MRNALFTAVAAFGSLTPVASALADEHATHCEIYIDKVAAQQTAYHGAFGAILNTKAYIKLDLNQLAARGGPVRVVFYGTRRTVDNSGRVTSDTGAQEIELSPFYGADYYEFSMGDIENHWWDSNNAQDANQFEGAFFVETRDGSRLWTNPNGPGTSFLFDEGAAGTLRSRGEVFAGSPYGAARKTSLEEITRTADYNTYWNPYRCR